MRASLLRVILTQLPPAHHLSCPEAEPGLVSDYTDVPSCSAPRAVVDQAWEGVRSFCRGALWQKQTWCLLCHLLVHHAFHFLQLSARRELKKYFRWLAARSSVLGDLGWFALSPYLGGRIALVFSFFCCLRFTCSFIFLQFSFPSPAL